MTKRALAGELLLPRARGRRMQRIDGYYLYTIGGQLAPLRAISHERPFSECLVPLIISEQALDPLLHQSVFRLRHCLRTGEALLAWVRHIKDKAIASSNFTGENPDEFELNQLKAALATFETNLASELGLSPTYIVNKKGGYDIADLMDNGRELFQVAIQIKVPEAIRDLEQATRCIAFEVPTAAGFHLHRANESVLRKYFDAIRGAVNHPGQRTMGAYLGLMEQRGLGDDRVRAALKDIKNLHRNPLAHPDQFLESVDEAIDLVGAIRAAIGAMLPAIAVPETVGALQASNGMAEMLDEAIKMAVEGPKTEGDA